MIKYSQCTRIGGKKMGFIKNLLNKDNNEETLKKYIIKENR